MEIDYRKLIDSDRDSIEDHHEFMADSTFVRFFNRLGPFFEGKPTVYYVYFDPQPPPAVFESPAVEKFIAYFPATSNSADRENWEVRFKRFLTILPGAEGYKNHATGWVLEEVDHEKVEGKVKPWITAIGWESVEAHKAFRETVLFKDNVGLLREGPTAAEMHHLTF